MDEDVRELAERAGAALRERGWMLATAESCTGGLLGHLITEIAGSSAWYAGGIISYSNEVKEQLLGVPAEVLAQHGAVSEQTATAMADGARKALNAEVGLSTTGIAGPGGGTPQKPVGLVYIGLALPGDTHVERHIWSGDRSANKLLSARRALELLLEVLPQ